MPRVGFRALDLQPHEPVISLVIVWTTTGHLAGTCSRSVYYLYDGIDESSVNLVSTTIPRNPLITDRIFNLLSTAVSEA